MSHRHLVTGMVCTLFKVFGQCSCLCVANNIAVPWMASMDGGLNTLAQHDMHHKVGLHERHRPL